LPAAGPKAPSISARLAISARSPPGPRLAARHEADLERRTGLPGVERGDDTMRRGRAIRSWSVTEPEPVIREVLSFESLPPEQRGSRRAVVRWSDGRVAEALRWWDDEILTCDGDLVGKSASQVRALHFHRDREFLQSRER
jgi:hypothetical protein